MTSFLARMSKARALLLLMLDEVELVPPLLDDIMVLRPIADLITALMTGRINLGLMTLDTMTDLLLGLTMSVTDMTVGTGTMTEGTTIVMLETDTMITTEAAVVLPTLITTVANVTVVTKGEMRGPDTMRGLGIRSPTGWT